jgi:hypothetical protein
MVKATIRETDGTTLTLEGDGVDVATILASLNQTETVELSVEAAETVNWWNDADYWSHSQGETVDVVDMETTHLANAIAKKARIGRGSVMSPYRHMELTRENLFELMKDEEFRSMISELAFREEEEENG